MPAFVPPQTFERPPHWYFREYEAKCYKNGGRL